MKSKAVFHPKEVKKVLVFAYTGLGNFVLYTPTLRAIRQSLPHAIFTLLHGNDTDCHEVVTGSDLFDKYIIVRRDADWWTSLKWIYRLRKEKYDLVISEFHNNNLFMVLVTTLSGARYRLGHVTSPGWNNSWDWIYNIPAKMRKDQHERERYLELAYALGIDRNKRAPKTFVYLKKGDEVFAENLLRNRGVKYTEKLIGLHPGTSPTMSWKQWPIEKYKKLCERILEIPNTRILILGASSECDFIKQLIDGENERIIDAAGKTTVKQASSLIKRTSVFIGNDSGLAKISIAVDTPTITIWGPSDYPRAKAWKAGHYDIRKDLACSPCFQMDGTEKVENCPYGYECLDSISVDEVFEAIVTKLKSH